MLSRSSFNIRRLISQSRPDSPDADELSDHDEIARLKLQQRRQSARPARPLTRPDDSLLIQRAQSVHLVNGPIPPLPADSPRSSSSSIYSFDHYVPGFKETNQEASLCLPRGKINDRHRPLTPKRLSERKHLIITPLQRTSTAKPPADYVPDQTALGRTPSDPAVSVSPEKAVSESKDGTELADDWSETVQQLIRETDQAFQAVGAALAEAQITSLSTIPSVESRAVSLPPPCAPRTPRKAPAELSLRRQSAKCATPPLTPTRTASVSKVKRTKSKKPKKSRRPVVSSKHLPRWALGENVTDILTGQFFRKIEADEMLAPERLQTARLSRDYQLRQRRSSETLFTDDSETPVEPFHLEDLPSRIGAAGVQTSVAPIVAVSLPIPFDQPVRRDFSVERKTPRTCVKGDTEGDSQMKFKTLTFPSPPMKNPARYHSRAAQQSPPLATIPEVLVTSPVSDKDDVMPLAEMRVRHRGRTFAPIHDEDFVFFKSTPCTLTMPTFRHGRIRFPKSEVVKGRKIAADDTLDWTAFQMAILGGAGDFFSDPSDFAPRTEADEVDELTGWFDSFGFEHHGLLITTGSAWEGSPSTLTGGNSSPTSSILTDTDTDLPIPVGPEYPTGFWNEGHVDASKFLQDQGHCNIRRWTMDGPKKRYKQDSEGSLESLPQSPLMEVVYLGGACGEGDAVSVGFNLGHDLGDFLRWEAENSYASPIWGPG